MAVEKMPAGKTSQTKDLAHSKGHAALAWHHFFRSLSEEKIPDERSALPGGIQE
ncbi:hypothetical protein AXZ77_0712 [Thioclava sp. ES.031]|uniref:hypothetical protein n=1 Tax=unclassified Thioclava TaxID=2621713 RepID=UPI000C01828A|nr:MULTISPECIES: hypothetical protein [unclassified Thioclava]PFG62142.1 hypothetical protein AXZ77_0712 [Thioclava sp. ES.031]